MRIVLYHDETASLELECIAANLTRIVSHLKFDVGSAKFSVKDTQLTSPYTYQRLSKALVQECKQFGYAYLFTEKPYDTNYFWMPHPDQAMAIMSMYAWDHLTDFSRNNGAVYLIFSSLIRTSARILLLSRQQSNSRRVGLCHPRRLG